jgi:hypothetical protein
MARGDIGLIADDGPYVGLQGLMVELNSAEEVTVVGEGERGHTEAPGSLHQVIYARRAVKKAVVAVDVKMDKIIFFHRNDSV